MKITYEEFRELANATTLNQYLVLRLFLDNPGTWHSKVKVGNLLREEEDWKGRKPVEDCPLSTTIRGYLAALVSAGMLKKKTTGAVGGEIEYKMNRRVAPMGRTTAGTDDVPPTSDNVNWLKFWEVIISKYDGLPIVDEIGQFMKINKLDLEGIDRKAFRIIDFETSDYGAWWVDEVNEDMLQDNLRTIYNCIKEKDTMTFAYLGFEGSNENYGGRKKGKDRIEEKGFKPYILKEVMGRWYVHGISASHDEWRSYSLERIRELDEDDVKPRFTREKFDPDKLWKHSIGITRYGEPVRVEFKLKDGPVYNNIQYLNSVPIMPDGMQKVHEKKDSRGFVRVTLDKVHIGPELVRKIRAFGLDNVKVVKPAWLDEDLREKGKTDTVTFKCKLKKGETEGDLKTYVEENLRIYKGGDSAKARVNIKPQKKKKVMEVTVQDVRVNSTLAYFVHRLYTEKRLVGKNAYEIFKKKYLK